MNSPSSPLAVGQVAGASGLELFPVLENSIHSTYHILRLSLVCHVYANTHHND